ncbi:VOC family protein [Nonomuraea sp. CA-141351]|uniref:VOC family protein n=1 Tax=Nonomuraea sp. CA-141351 TaxID=3239996 RepID=UPI003D8A58C8
MTGSSSQEIKTVLHPVSDLAKAKAVYAALLGVAPQTDSSYYVGFEVGGGSTSGWCRTVGRRA